MYSPFHRCALLQLARKDEFSVLILGLDNSGKTVGELHPLRPQALTRALQTLLEQIKTLYELWIAENIVKGWNRVS